MKYIITLIFVVTFTSVYCQQDSELVNDIKSKHKGFEFKKSAFFLNSELMNCESESFNIFFDPAHIDNIMIEKGIVQYNGNTYNGKILITTKKDEPLNLLSQEQITTEFAKGKNLKTLYMIDGQFITTDIKSYRIEKEYILNLELVNDRYVESLDIDIIQIFTKSKVNLDKKNQIIIR